MQALILAGGKGTRLQPLTIEVPKPVIPVGNQPFLAVQLQMLKKIGVTDIVLSLNYQPSAIRKILGDCFDSDLQINYLIEPRPLGTAGAYKFAESFLNSATLVLNGDILTDIDLRAVVEQHKKYHSVATIVLTKVENPAGYGLVEVGEDNRVANFYEKPSLDEIGRLNINTVNAGIYVLEPEVLKCVPENEKCSFEYDLFPRLLRQNENFRAFMAADNYWLDIGAPQNYLQAHYDLLNGKFKNFQVDRNHSFKASEKTEIDDLSLIGEGCVIKRRAKIINSVLGKNVVIGEDAVILNSVIWSGTEIDSQSGISDSIIGKDCRIGKNISLSGAILGNNAFLG